jgi:hypothetical protein
MSQAVITKAFVEWKAQQAVDNKPVTLDEFIFAFIPDLDIEKPIDDTETTPPADKIVHRQAVSKSGVINGDSVVYSVTLGADVGDFDFNWIGLVNKATGTLAMIIHAPTQRKIKNASGQQGNVLVRSMLMEYSGAEAATNITTPAETWQIDFTARLASMDERQRVENIDLYGAAAFFDTGYLVGKNNTQYFVTKGAGYVAGLRTELLANQNIAVSTKPVKVWLDVSWAGTLTSVWTVKSKITVAANLSNYVEGGVQHYVFALASIDANGNITDLRPVGGLDDQALKEHEKSRNHPDATTTEKGFTKLSSAVDSASESLAATPKAVKAVNDELTKVKNSLGSASEKDIVTSKTDTTAGRVPIVGWMSLGGYGTDNMIAGADAIKPLRNGFYGVQTEPTYGNAALISFGYDSGSQVHIIAKQGGQAPVLGVCGSTPQGVFGRWGKIYTEFQKPTPGDIGAVAKTGDTMTGALTVPGIINTGDHFFRNLANRHVRFEYLKNDGTWATDGYIFKDGVDSPTRRPGIRINCATPNKDKGNTTNSGDWVFGEDGTLTCPGAINGHFVGAGSYASQNDSGSLAPFFQLINDTSSSKFYPILKQRFTQGGGTWSLGTIINAGNFQVFYLSKSDTAGKSFTFDKSGQFIPPNYANFDARYQPKGNYTPAGQAYTKAESDARYQAKGSYITGIRFGASTEYNERSNTERMTGGVMTSWADRGSSNYWMRLRPLQYQINGGSWVTAAYA